MSDVNAAVDARIAAALVSLTARVSALESRVLPVVPAPVPTPTPAPAPPPQAGERARRMGINLSSPSYWSPSWPFVDLMKTSRAGWMEAPTGLNFDPDGYPTFLAPGEKALTILARDVDGHYPAGVYTITWDGEGTIALSGDAVLSASKSPADVAITPTPGGTLDLRITRSTPGNPLRNLRVLGPGAAWGQHAQFRQGFLDRLRPFSVLRFMDWTRTNRKPNDGLVDQVNWSDRPKLTARTWTGGVPWEVCIDLANAVGADPWLCIPHLASEDYTRELAKLVKSRLAPGLRVYLEYSNEVWNGGFAANKWVESVDNAENVRQTYARLATDHFRSWEEGWGDRARLVRVLSGQAGNVDVARQILVAAGTGACDAIASAPYFGGDLGRDATVASWPVDKILDAAAADVPLQRSRMAAHKALADAHGVVSIAYEGGQHLAAVGALTENASLVAKLTEANRHPRMGAIYSDYLRAWEETGGGLFCHFDDVRMPGKAGSWGLWEWHNQPDTPKAAAVLSAAGRWKA